MKKILLFRHISICNNLFNSLNDYISHELNKRGIECAHIDITQPSDTVLQEMEAKIDDSFDAALAFNETCFHNSVKDGQNIFDRYGIPFFNWIVDHPIGISEYFETNSVNYNVLCMDRLHVEFVKRHQPNIKSVSFLPLGGISGDKDALVPLRSRPYDIAFPGGFLPKTLSDSLDEYNRLQEPNRTIILNLLDYLMDNRNIDVTTALNTVLKDRFGIDSMNYDDYNIALDLAASANDFMRSYLREEVLRTVIGSGLEFHIFGNGWNDRIGNYNGNTTFHKGVPYDMTGDIFGNAKILLNVMPCFKDGTHDRIASGMLHNSLVITDHSKFLDELPTGLMRFYNIDNTRELPDMLRESLSDIEKSQSIADKGYEYATEHFTWDKTMDKLLELIKVHMAGDGK